jgi:hypothetical protein
MLKENPAGMTKPTISFEQPNCSSFSMQRGIIASDDVAAKTNRISSLKYPKTRDSLKPHSLSRNPKTTTMNPRQTANTANTNWPRSISVLTPNFPTVNAMAAPAPMGRST